jgi:hypothetical protein
MGSGPARPPGPGGECWWTGRWCRSCVTPDVYERSRCGSGYVVGALPRSPGRWVRRRGRKSIVQPLLSHPFGESEESSPPCCAARVQRLGSGVHRPCSGRHGCLHDGRHRIPRRIVVTGEDHGLADGSGTHRLDHRHHGDGKYLHRNTVRRQQEVRSAPMARDVPRWPWRRDLLALP